MCQLIRQLAYIHPTSFHEAIEISQMTHWAFCEDLSSEHVLIEESEAHHLLHVLRIQPEAQLSLFDGNGTVAHAVVVSVSRRDVKCHVQTRERHQQRASPHLTVVAAPPKADRLKWMVEKLTELGVSRLVLLNSQRTVVTPGESRVDKLRANVIAACKQCNRPFLMELVPLQSFDSVIHDLSAKTFGHRSFIAHPGTPDERPNVPGVASSTVSLLIGPEGGFTDAEVEQAEHAGISRVAWPGTILRIETAAIVFATLALSERLK